MGIAICTIVVFVEFAILLPLITVDLRAEVIACSNKILFLCVMHQCILVLHQTIVRDKFKLLWSSVGLEIQKQDRDQIWTDKRRAALPLYLFLEPRNSFECQHNYEVGITFPLALIATYVPE